MPKLAHIVYFTLIDNSEAARTKLVDACKKYLDGHPGAVYFAVGTLNRDLRRDVNDLAFDVALHLVFASRADHDVYQTAPRHESFIQECKANWKSVRVFDSDVD